MWVVLAKCIFIGTDELKVIIDTVPLIIRANRGVKFIWQKWNGPLISLVKPGAMRHTGAHVQRY